MKKLFPLLLVSFVCALQAKDIFVSHEMMSKNLILNTYVKKSNGLLNYSKAFDVRFAIENNKLLLMSQNGEVDYAFSVKSQSEQGVLVDLSTGLKTVQFQSSIYKTELPLTHPQLKKYVLTSDIFESISIVQNDEQRLLTEIKLNLPDYDSITLEIAPNNTRGFESETHNRSDEVGVYATYPSLEGTMYLAKQSLPATYLYDENFPVDLLPSLKQAIAYWNKALGSKLIKLEKAKNKSDALKIGVNYIDYYSNRDDDGGARGIFNLAPNSGEILSSYIYIPSGFKVWGTKYFSEKFPLTNEANIRQIVLDYLTHTLAHEIGHTLGLRHNFAASTQSSLNANNYKKKFYKYLNRLKISRFIVPAISVMDYISIDYFALMGAKMRLRHKPLSYDKKAVRWLYRNKRIKDFGNFCTHFDEPPTIDDGGDAFCQAWDEPHAILAN